MPVLSSEDHRPGYYHHDNDKHNNMSVFSSSLPNSNTLLLASIILLLVGSYIKFRPQLINSRKTAANFTTMNSEKGSLETIAPAKENEEGKSAVEIYPMSVPSSSMPRSMTFPPLPLPTVRPEPMASSTSNSFESLDQGLLDNTNEFPAPPRRRSYTKSTDAGIDVSGEILVADGGAGAWRRHTKVFGGGVCVACVENERRMSA